MKQYIQLANKGSLGGESEKVLWFEQQTIKRSYQEQVLTKLEALSSSFDMIQYGSLTIDESRYPLYVMQSKNWQTANPNVLGYRGSSWL